METPTAEKVMVIKIDPEIRPKLEAVADAHRRSNTAEIHWLIEREYERIKAESEPSNS